MVVGELLALLLTVTPPVTLPVVVGAKVTFKAADWPGDRTVTEVLALNPAPVVVTLEMVMFELPELLRVTPRVLVAPASMLPKLKLVGLALSARVEALTVSVAALLVTLPRLLLTATVNDSPLSELVVKGVV